MRNDSVSSRETPPAHHARARDTHVRQEQTRGREEVQRFRKLMDGPAKDSSQETSAGVSGGQRGLSSNEQEQALRELLQRQLDAAAERAPGVPPRGEESDGQDGSSDGGSSSDQSLPTAGAQAWHQAQQIVLHGTEQPAPAAQAALAPALAELIERHVKQLLVPDTRSSAQAREIMITLKDGVLPGAELWLSRTDKGWKLRVDTHAPDTYRQLLEDAPQLVERFADKHLGELEIDPVWHG